MFPVGVSAVGLWLGCASLLGAAEIHPPGMRPGLPERRALVGGRVVVCPGQVLDPGIILVRGDRIEAVGSDLRVPEDAEVWRTEGLTLHAGFIKPLYVPVRSNASVDTRMTEPVGAGEFGRRKVPVLGCSGAGHGLRSERPGTCHGASDSGRAGGGAFDPGDRDWTVLRELSLTAAVLAPGEGILRGRSALVFLGEEGPNRLMLRPDVFQHMAFEPARGLARQEFPSSLMAVLARCVGRRCWKLYIIAWR